MKGSCGCVVGLLLFVMLLVVLVGPVMSSRHLPRQPGSDHRHRRSSQARTTVKDQRMDRDWDVRRVPPMLGHGKLLDTVQVAGSRLPDCSHACGSCSPCRLVMVSYVCSSIQEAETCPMAYKCMCHNRSYPVP